MSTTEAAQKGQMVLAAARRGAAGPLVPEQEASFDLTLRNDAPTEQTALALDGNLLTPVVRVLDAQGKVLVEASPAASVEKVVGNFGPVAPPPPRTRAYPPSDTESMWLNVWTLTYPLGAGAYGFEAVHHLDAGGARLLRSNRVPFAIVDARVGAHAAGYESSARMASLLAWVATPAASDALPGEPAARVLARLSGFSDHGAVQQGATLIADAPPEARIALSHTLVTDWLGWIAVVSGRQVELVRHNMTHPQWRSGPVPLELDDPVLIPDFPSRGVGLFLSAGVGPRGLALAGVAVSQGGAPRSWTTPLSAAPTRAACWFGAQGPVVVLYVADDGANARYHRLDVDDAGAVVTAERVVRTSPNRVLAVASDMRPGAPAGFLALEQSRLAPDRIALIRLPVGGAPSVVPFAPAAGWPAIVEPGGPRPLQAAEVSLGVGADGVPLLALVDERGSLSGGRLDGSPLRLLHDALSAPGGAAGSASGPALRPHIAAFRNRVQVGGFTARGALLVEAL